MASFIAEILFSFVILALVIVTVRRTLLWFNSFEIPPHILPVPHEKNLPFGEVAAKVNVGLYVYNFPTFSIENGTFSLDGTIWFEFYSNQISLEDLGKFEFFEATITSKSIAQIKQIDDKIFVAYNFKVTFSSFLNSEKFPFADHRIFLILKNESLSAKELNFYSSNGEFVVTEGLCPEGWRLMKTKVETGMTRAKLAQFDARKTILIPITVFEFDFVKPGFRYVLLTLVPAFILFYLAIYSLLLHLRPGQKDLIVAISLASITGLIIQRFVIESISPKSGHSTTIDYIFILLLSLCFTIFILHVIILGWSNIKYLNHVGFYLLQVIMLVIFWVILSRKDLETPIAKKVPLFHYLKSIFKKNNLLFPDLIALKNYQEFAANLDEFPQKDNTNPLFPDYSGYFQTRSKSNFSRLLKNLLSKMGLHFEEDLATHLKKNLEDIVEKQNPNNLNDVHLLLHPFKKGEKYYIWGDLNGAFHSLVRSLNHLEKQDVINDKLQILQPHYFLIFNGNAIGPSPYNLETLSLIIALMMKNPQNVFYIRGQHEDKEFWLNAALGKELEILAKDLSSDEIPLEKLITQFFNGLPATLCLGKIHKKENEYITISPRSPTLVDSERLSKAFQNISSESFMTLEEQNNHSDGAFPFIFARLRGLEDGKSYRQPQGVDLLPPEEGSTQWSIFSSPVTAHQEHFNFNLDAYAILEIASSLGTTFLTRVTRNLNGEQAFNEENFDLLSGRSMGHSKSHKEWFKRENEIRIGATLDLTETISIAGETFKRGIDLCLRKANKEGGIDEGFLRLFIANDKYAPSITLQNAQKFISQDNASLLLSPMGTLTTEALIPLTQEKKIIMLFPTSGANVFRDPDLHNIINYRASYADEARALVRYARDVLFKQRFAFFFQNDDYGRDSLNAAKKVLYEEYHLSKEALCEASYERNTINVDHAARTIANFNPDVIFFFSTYSPSRVLLEKIELHRISKVTLMGISFITDLFRDFASGIWDPEQQGKGLTFIISRVVPNPEDSTIEIVREYQLEMQKEYPDVRFDVGSLEGYITASILLDILKKIGRPFTHERIIREIEKIKDTDFKGLPMNFNPLTRGLSKDVWLELEDGKWIHAQSE
ncbi:MAG: hypothetical protein BGO67_01145 [Alphaproteobacteria bacterium 41-28]|nr:MAG: hypothetical protein BGO67_01145 [Alphaproteobacteria bacterium 41-28]